MSDYIEGDYVDAARNEAEKRWPAKGNPRTPQDWLHEGQASGFVLGAQWATEAKGPTFTGVQAADVIHLYNPEHGPSYCAEPVTLIKEAGDTRPVCQACHRGAMKTRRHMSRDALARGMYLTHARAHQHPDDPTTPERRWSEGFEFKSQWFHQADRLLDIVDASVRKPTTTLAAKVVATDE